VVVPRYLELVRQAAQLKGDYKVANALQVQEAS
jgi:hypothetical protein